MEENKTIDSNVEVEGGATETENEVQVKTFTQEEVDKMITKRLAREKRDLEAKIESERQEAEKLAKMNAEEKAKHEFEKQKREFEDMKKAFEGEKLLNETTNQLASKNLPTEFASMLKGEDAETTFENIKVFEEKFNSALEKAVTERLKGKTPTTSTVQGNSLTKEQFRKMSAKEQTDLFRSNKDEYMRLINL